MNKYVRLLISGSVYCTSMAIMAVFGDAVAWHRLPTYEDTVDSIAHILPDVGFDAFPYYCPIVSGFNIQTLAIVCPVAFFAFRCVFCLKNGVFVIQRFLHTSSVVMILRTLTLSVTSFPNPNPRCMGSTVTDNPLFGSRGTILRIVTSFPPSTCGNLMFSGHTAYLILLVLFDYKYSVMPRKLFSLSIGRTILGLYSVIACRSHYSVDVVVSVLITTFTFVTCNEYLPQIPYLRRLERDDGDDVRNGCYGNILNNSCGGYRNRSDSMNVRYGDDGDDRDHIDDRDHLPFHNRGRSVEF